MPKARSSKKARTHPFKPPSSSSHSLATPIPKTTLFSLPIELLEEIVSYLPLGSPPALALCCRRSFQIFGHHYTNLLKDPRRHVIRSAPTKFDAQLAPRLAFLQLLERNRPDVVYCEVCQMLHSPDDKVWGRRCYLAEQDLLKVGFCKPYYWVYWAMRRYREGVPLEDAFKGMPDSKNPIYDHVSKTLTQRHVVRRVIDDRLYQRTQQWRFCPMSEDFCSGLELCPHDPKYFSLKLRYVVRFALGQGYYCCRYNATHSRRNEDICAYCLTTYQIDVKRLDKKSSLIVYVVTKWEDFGHIRSRYDPDWARHFQEGEWSDALKSRNTSRVFEGGKVFNPFDFEDGMSRDEFQKLVARWEQMQPGIGEVSSNSQDPDSES